MTLMQVVFKINRLKIILRKMRTLKIPMSKRVGNILPGLLLRTRMTKTTLMYMGQGL